MTPEYHLDYHQTKALRAFWHKSRRQIVACTSADVEARSGLSAANVHVAMWKLSSRGIISAIVRLYPQIYDLTPKGRDMLAEIIK
jgi:DNA-binding MarR family transcriptional regulator